MHLSDAHISQFQMLHKKAFGTDISKADAMEKGIRLVRLMEIVLKQEAKARATKAPPLIVNH